MNETESYPASDVTARQVECLIKSTAELQTQILRKFAKSVLEEMRYHLWVAQEKCKMDEETIATLSSSIEIERSAAVNQEMTLLQEFKRLAQLWHSPKNVPKNLSASYWSLFIAWSPANDPPPLPSPLTRPASSRAGPFSIRRSPHRRSPALGRQPST